MVTEQEIKNRVFTVDFEGSEHSFRVTDSQMRGLSLETVVFGAVFPSFYSKSYHRGHFPKS